MRKKEDEYTLELKKLEATVLPKYIKIRENWDREHGYTKTSEYTIQSLNSTINCRIDGFANIKEKSYFTIESLLDVYWSELKKHKEDVLYDLLHDIDCLKYFELFMRRYFVRKEKELSRNKPKSKMYEVWFGDNNNCFGLMITPVYRYSFQEKKYIWENDKSEIRKVDFRYWSVAHVLKTGLIDIEKGERISFADVEELIEFYTRVFYDKSKSEYEKLIMQKYFELLKQHSDYDKIAFLIPELRFKKEKLHKYRLDFTVLSAEGNNKSIGFELSPDSTHAYTHNIEQKKPYEIKGEEIERWGNEIGKRNEYDEEFSIHVRTFMESDLHDINKCFENIREYIIFEEDIKGEWDKFRQEVQNDLT